MCALEHKVFGFSWTLFSICLFPVWELRSPAWNQGSKAQGSAELVPWDAQRGGVRVLKGKMLFYLI